MTVRADIRAAAAMLGLALVAVMCTAGAQTASQPYSYSASALYNQGNAEARAGRPALAILNYARARILAPRDADIRANLLAVQHSVGLPDHPDGWFSEHARFASPDTVYWWGFAGLMMLGGALVARRASSRRRLTSAVAALGLVMVLMSTGDMLVTRPLLQQSVVLHPTAARASPAGASDPLFTLAAAALVRVEERHQAFVLVRDADGRQGWAADTDLMPVVPREGGAGPRNAGSGEPGAGAGTP